MSAGRPWDPLPSGHRDPTTVKGSLDKLAATLGLTDIASIQALFVDWEEIVGSQLAAHCKPKRLSEGVLTVEASDQQWATELQWMTSLLIERCCEALGDGAVRQVRITQ
jgi:predicted nucleic acid-binding Zn ribbon protein